MPAPPLVVDQYVAVNDDGLVSRADLVPFPSPMEQIDDDTPARLHTMSALSTSAAAAAIATPAAATLPVRVEPPPVADDDEELVDYTDEASSEAAAVGATDTDGDVKMTGSISVTVTTGTSNMDVVEEAPSSAAVPSLPPSAPSSVAKPTAAATPILSESTATAAARAATTATTRIEQKRPAAAAQPRDSTAALPTAAQKPSGTTRPSSSTSNRGPSDGSQSARRVVSGRPDNRGREPSKRDDARRSVGAGNARSRSPPSRAASRRSSRSRSPQRQGRAQLKSVAIPVRRESPDPQSCAAAARSVVLKPKPKPRAKIVRITNEIDDAAPIVARVPLGMTAATKIGAMFKQNGEEVRSRLFELAFNRGACDRSAFVDPLAEEAAMTLVKSQTRVAVDLSVMMEHSRFKDRLYAACHEIDEAFAPFADLDTVTLGDWQNATKTLHRIFYDTSRIAALRHGSMQAAMLDEALNDGSGFEYKGKTVTAGRLYNPGVVLLHHLMRAFSSKVAKDGDMEQEDLCITHVIPEVKRGEGGGAHNLVRHPSHFYTVLDGKKVFDPRMYNRFIIPLLLNYTVPGGYGTKVRVVTKVSPGLASENPKFLADSYRNIRDTEVLTSKRFAVVTSIQLHGLDRDFDLIRHNPFGETPATYLSVERCTKNAGQPSLPPPKSQRASSSAAAATGNLNNKSAPQAVSK